MSISKGPKTNKQTEEVQQTPKNDKTPTLFIKK